MENFMISRSHKMMLNGSIIINLIFTIISSFYLSTLFTNTAVIIGGSIFFVVIAIVAIIATVLVMQCPSNGRITFGYIAAVICLLFLNQIGPILMIIAFSQISKEKKQTELQSGETPVYTQQSTEQNTNETNVFEQK